MESEDRFWMERKKNKKNPGNILSTQNYTSIFIFFSILFSLSHSKVSTGSLDMDGKHTLSEIRDITVSSSWTLTQSQEWSGKRGREEWGMIEEINKWHLVLLEIFLIFQKSKSRREKRIGIKWNGSKSVTHFCSNLFPVIEMDETSTQ